MDKNKVKSITGIANNLHDDVDTVYEALMDDDIKEVAKAVEVMTESLKHLKESLKIDDI